MSIFEPIPRESRWDEGSQEPDEAPVGDDTAPPGGSLDPRSIRIAGLVVVAIVVAGLVASNTAEPEDRPQRLVPARVDPGAAAVEQAEAKRPVPTADASASVDPADEADGDAPTWDEPEDSGDDSRWSGDTKSDNKPGKGRGRGRG